ncbi:TolC family outer membrane protein [Variovorax paradoxus]|nr:TolC family outer membrane protein [Variovorax paradoxus]
MTELFYRHLRAGLMLFMAGALCAPAAAQVEDLMDVYRKAIEHDPLHESARRTLEAAEQKLPQAMAGLLPAVALTGGTGRQQADASFSGAAAVERDVRSWNWNLQLTQPLFRWANVVAHRQAGAQVRQAREQYRLAEHELMLRVAQAYFDVLVAHEGISVADAQRQAVEQQLMLARRNFEVGMATVTDAYEAQSRFDLARAQAVAARTESDARWAELERILGTAPAGLRSLDAAAELPRPVPEDLQAWMSRAREEHPQVLIQLAAQDAAASEIERSRAAHWPTLDLTASHGSNYASGTVSSPADISTRVRSTQLGLQLSIPLYSGGAIDSRVREAISFLARADAELEAARRQAAASARQAFSAVANGRAQAEALRSAVQTSQSALDANKIGYRIGTRINIDVLNAEQQLHAARRDLFRACTDTILQSLRLKAAAGTLAVEDIESINRLTAAGGIIPAPAAALAATAGTITAAQPQRMR